MSFISRIFAIARKVEAMIFAWRDRYYRRRRRRAPKLELMGGPGDGTILFTNYKSIVYVHVDNTRFLYVLEEDDSSAEHRRAYFRGMVELVEDGDGEIEVWLAEG